MGPPKRCDVGQEFGLDGQPGVFPLSDYFAEMSGIPVNDDGGEQVEPGHAVVLALAPTASSGNSAACMPPASIPSAISPNSAPSQDQPSIAHSTGAFPLSVRSCPLPESTRTWWTPRRGTRKMVAQIGFADALRRVLQTTVPAISRFIARFVKRLREPVNMVDVGQRPRLWPVQ